MRASIFPGQGSQFPGMAKDLYNLSDNAKKMFLHANDILGFNITDIMFGEDVEALKQTKVTQPAIFIHSVILSKIMNSKNDINVVAGHSLGEFSALVAAKYLSFEDGLKLVSKRAKAMQKSCEEEPSTMAAILGLEDNIIERICKETNEIVTPANYNCPGQLVISGSEKGIDIACKKLIAAGAKRALKLPVSGGFHSEFMNSARIELENAIEETNFKSGTCPIYQNVNAKSTSNIKEIKSNLKKQLTSPVLWTQTMEQMIIDGVDSIIEIGPGKVLQNLFKKINREIKIEQPIL